MKRCTEITERWIHPFLDFTCCCCFPWKWQQVILCSFLLTLGWWQCSSHKSQLCLSESAEWKAHTRELCHSHSGSSSLTLPSHQTLWAPAPICSITETHWICSPVQKCLGQRDSFHDVMELSVCLRNNSHAGRTVSLSSVSVPSEDALTLCFQYGLASFLH